MLVDVIIQFKNIQTQLNIFFVVRTNPDSCSHEVAFLTAETLALIICNENIHTDTQQT